MDRTLVAPEGLTKMHFICVPVDTGIFVAVTVKTLCLCLQKFLNFLKGSGNFKISDNEEIESKNRNKE